MSNLGDHSAPSPEMSDKSRKYDRQIRLWGDHGQSLLENAQVCLINASALGTEILKGLILPGIGFFCIVDNSNVTEEDVGCNFFLDPSTVGQSRAKNSVGLLQELNPDVNGDYIDENVEVIIEKNPEFFKTFNVVVTCALNEKVLVKLSNLLWELNIPLVACRSVGFISSARLQVKELCIIETHPDNKHNDLRLEEPFDTLKEHVDNIELTSKVPWLIVLYKHLQMWRAQNDNRLPSTYKEKSQIRDLIRSHITAEEENYEEAIKAVNSSFGGGKPSSSLQKILDDECCVNLNKNSNAFWIMVRALKDFVETEGNGYLPVAGVLPDMTAETSLYINLQNVYRSKALNDADCVYRRVQQLLKELNMSNELITDKDVRLFCREAAYLSIIRGTKIADEYDKNYKASKIAEELEMPDNLMGHYVALRAMEKFQAEHGYIPGECQVDTDIPRIKILSGKLLNEWGINSHLSDDLCHEICRYGGAEIHSVSAFLGGCIAHELIKIITKQYKPFNNTFIYDGITSQTVTYEL